MDVQK